MTQSPQIAVIGAGPYGLSIAAPLRARGIESRIFGTPMHSWRTSIAGGHVPEIGGLRIEPV
jgi:cation diffusion facilitator CzcD-associated flavoprotein CzcO